MTQIDTVRKFSHAPNSNLIERVRARFLSNLRHYAEMLLPDGKQVGGEWQARSPFRADANLGSFSLVLETRASGMPAGKFFDFAASGEARSGDIIDLALHVWGFGPKGHRALAERLGVDNGLSVVPDLKPVFRPATPSEGADKETDWIAVFPCVTEPLEAQFRHFSSDLGMPSHRWRYVDAHGRTLGFACRFHDKRKNAKTIRVLTEVRHRVTQATTWRYLPWPGMKVRPLFGEDRLAGSPTAPVLVVEGEKCADAAQSILPDWVVVTWPLGVQGVKKADWEKLHGREVTIWPDNDAAGFEAADKIFGKLAGKAKVSIMAVPPGKPEAWDVADAIESGETVDQIRAWIATHARREAPKPPGTKPALSPGESFDNETGEIFPADDRVGFDVLGHTDDRFWFFQRKGQLILGLKVYEISKHEPMLAPAWWWLQNYGFDKRKEDGSTVREFSSKIAASKICDKAYDVGVFDIEKQRGRGLWIDGDSAVLNTGMELFRDGAPATFGKASSDYFYRPRKIPYVLAGNALTSADGQRLFELLQLLPWCDAVSSPQLLAGWIFLAPVCGALFWRPHIWLLGQAGSGKSWAFANIVANLLRGWSLYIKGQSTEAGIRQKLAFDAVPIIYDEVDGTSQKDLERISQILEFARVASSEDDARVVKGSAGGVSMEFQAQTMIAFASVNEGAVHHQDKTRITQLQFNVDDKAGSVERFQKLLDTQKALLTMDFRKKMHLRAFSMITVIRENCEVFSQVLAKQLGSRRAGDQLGTLLAGYWSLTRAEAVTVAEAEQYTADHFGQIDALTEVRRSSNESDCVSHVFNSMIRVDDGTRMVELPVRRVFAHLSGTHDPELVVPVERLKRGLESYGLKFMLVPEGPRLFVANQNQNLARLFSGTPFAANWASLLKRTPDAVTPVQGERFNGVRTRGTLVKLPD